MLISKMIVLIEISFGYQILVKTEKNSWYSKDAKRVFMFNLLHLRETRLLFHL